MMKLLRCFGGSDSDEFENIPRHHCAYPKPHEISLPTQVPPLTSSSFRSFRDSSLPSSGTFRSYQQQPERMSPVKQVCHSAGVASIPDDDDFRHHIRNCVRDVDPDALLGEGTTHFAVPPCSPATPHLGGGMRTEAVDPDQCSTFATDADARGMRWLPPPRPRVHRSSLTGLIESLQNVKRHQAAFANSSASSAKYDVGDDFVAEDAIGAERDSSSGRCSEYAPMQRGTPAGGSGRWDLSCGGGSVGRTSWGSTQHVGGTSGTERDTRGSSGSSLRSDSRRTSGSLRLRISPSTRQGSVQHHAAECGSGARHVTSQTSTGDDCSSSGVFGGAGGGGGDGAIGAALLVAKQVLDNNSRASLSAERSSGGASLTAERSSGGPPPALGQSVGGTAAPVSERSLVGGFVSVSPHQPLTASSRPRPLQQLIAESSAAMASAASSPTASFYNASLEVSYCPSSSASYCLSSPASYCPSSYYAFGPRTLRDSMRSSSLRSERSSPHDIALFDEAPASSTPRHATVAALQPVSPISYYAMTRYNSNALPQQSAPPREAGAALPRAAAALPAPPSSPASPVPLVPEHSTRSWADKRPPTPTVSAAPPTAVLPTVAHAQRRTSALSYFAMGQAQAGQAVPSGRRSQSLNRGVGADGATAAAPCQRSNSRRASYYVPHVSSDVEQQLGGSGSASGGSVRRHNTALLDECYHQPAAARRS